MSRIHEALKKAAEERSAQVAERNAPELIELTSEELSGREPQAGKLVPPPVVGGLAKAAVTLKPYDEFVRRCQRPAWKMETRSSVFSPETKDLVGAEKFRTLRSRLHQIAAAQKLQKIVITSSLPAEGKTFIAANLAQSFTRQADKKVLLIDADLRASRLNLMLGAPGKPGLSDYLRGDVEDFQVTQVGPDGNLCLIPGGREVENPSELLHSERMKLLLDKMATLFDWVILDSPPALAVHDASILADMTDGVLFVVRAGATNYQLAEKAASEFAEKNLLGVVLNRAEKHDTYGGYYYGYAGEKAEEKGRV